MLLHSFCPPPFSINSMNFWMTSMIGQWTSNHKKVHILEVHSPLSFYLTLHEIYFNTGRIFSRSFVICFCNGNRRYICCECITMLLTLEERYTTNWFQFTIYNTMTWIVSILNIEVVSQRTKLVLPEVLFLWVYPFNIVPTKLEPPIIPMIIGHM